MKALGIAALAIAALVAAFVADHYFLGTPYPSLPEWAQPAPLPPAPIGASRIAASPSYGLALMPDNRLYVWGGTEQGSVEAPMILVEGATDWRAIAAGHVASYAVGASGSLWRRSMVRRTDGGVRAYRAVLKGLRWSKVQSLADITVGLDADGTLHAWHERLLEAGGLCPRAGGLCHAISDEGTFAEGTFDTGESAVRLDMEETYALLSGRPVTWPLPEGPWMDFCAADTGFGRTVTVHALDASGQPWRLEVPRKELYPPLDPQVKATPIFAAVPFQRVYCSPTEGTVLLLDREQRLWGYGDNGDGALWPALKEEQARQRGDKYKQQSFRVEAKDLRQLTPRRWVAVAPGPGYTAAIAGDGSLWAWGARYHRDIRRDHSWEANAEAILIDGSRKWAEVAAGGSWLMARDAGGQVHTWGSTEGGGVTGLLGDGGVASHRDRPRPIVIAP